MACARSEGPGAPLGLVRRKAVPSLCFPPGRQMALSCPPVHAGAFGGTGEAEGGTFWEQWVPQDRCTRCRMLAAGPGEAGKALTCHLQEAGLGPYGLGPCRQFLWLCNLSPSTWRDIVKNS